MNNLQRTLLVALMGLLSGCALPRRGQYVPLPDQSKNVDDPTLSRIYVVRPPRMLSSAVGVPIADEDKPIGSISSGGFLSWEREPGKVKVQSVLSRHQTVELDVKAGERAFVKQEIGFLKSPLTAMDSSQGEELLKTLEPPSLAAAPPDINKVFEDLTPIEVEEKFFGKGFLFPYYALESGGVGYGLQYSRDVKSWLWVKADVSFIKGIDYEASFHGGAFEGVKGQVVTDLSPITQISVGIHPPFIPLIGLGIGMESYSFRSRITIKDGSFDLTGESRGTNTNLFYPILSGGLYFVNRTRPYRITIAVDFQIRGDNRTEFVLSPPSGTGQTYITRLNPLLSPVRFSLGVQFGLGQAGKR